MCVMERVAMFSRFGFSVTLLLLSLWHGAHGARMLSGTFQVGEQKWPELPPCNTPGAIPGWDCFDPPTHDLPPCDYKHQRPGVDCWPKTHPPAPKVTAMNSETAGEAASTHHGVQSSANTQESSSTHHLEEMLPPCKDVFGGIQNWDCYDPPMKFPLPHCNSQHYHIGIDCWPYATGPPSTKAVNP